MEDKGDSKDRSIGLESDYPGHVIRSIRCLDVWKLEVLFEEGVKKVVDMQPLAEELPEFRVFYKSPSLFFAAQAHRYGVIWNDEVDISEVWLWDHGETVSTAFDDLLSMREATERWGVNESTMRKAIDAGRFVVGQDVKRFGKQWVLVKGAVERVYGLELADLTEDSWLPPHEKRRVRYAIAHGWKPDFDPTILLKEEDT